MGKKVKPKTWRIFAFADAISMTTGPKSSCEFPLTNRDPNNLTEAFPLPKKLYLLLLCVCLFSNKFEVIEMLQFSRHMNAIRI